MKKLLSYFLLLITCAINAQVITLYDSNTKENVTFLEIPTLPNGVKLDNVLFARKNGKYYKRVYNSSINVKWFGAKGDGISDDTEAIQKAINSAIGEVFFPVGVYNVSKKIIMQNNVRLRGVGAGAYFSGVGYERLTVIKPTQNFSDNSVIEIDPLNISSGLAYMFGISINDLLFDMINIKDSEKICLNILSLSNSETFSNIRIINNNKNIAINIDRSTSSASYEPDGLVFQNIYTLQNSSDNLNVNLPVLKIGSGNEISFYDSKFQRGADVINSTNSKTVFINSTMPDRASNAITFYSCSFAGAAIGIFAESRDVDGQGVRNLRINNGTFENTKFGIVLKGTVTRPNQFSTIIGNRFLTTAENGANIVLDDYASNNQIYADELTTLKTTSLSSNNMVIGGNLIENLGQNNAFIFRKGNSFDFNQYKTSWVTPTLFSGWVSNTSSRQTIAYSKEGNKIILRGYITGGTFGYPNYIAQLPVGYRPNNTVEIPVKTTGGLGTLVILSDGNFFVEGSTVSGAVSLTNVQFYVD